MTVVWLIVESVITDSNDWICVSLHIYIDFSKKIIIY